MVPAYKKLSLLNAIDAIFQFQVIGSSNGKQKLLSGLQRQLYIPHDKNNRISYREGE
jgi:hypothetical protein